MKQLIKEIEFWSSIYELNFQFWPENYSVYIYKDGIELKSFGGELKMKSILKICLNYLRKINPISHEAYKQKGKMVDDSLKSKFGL